MNYSDENNNGVIDSNERLEENHYYPPDNIRDGLEHTYYDPGKKEYKRVQEGGGNDWQIKLEEVSNSGYQYKYNGKELQDELGLNWYDYGARNYDASLGRFISIDPKSEIYAQQSTYAYAVNNPILFMDINGEGVETDYKIIKKDKKDEKGKVTQKAGSVVRVDPKDGSENNLNDRLFATDEQGEVDNNVEPLTIDKKEASDNTAISDLADNEKIDGNSYAVVDNIDDAISVFKFAADNSNVEWQLSYFNSGSSVVSTSHEKGKVTPGDKLGLKGFNYNNLLLGIHSHPYSIRPSIYDRGYNIHGQEIPSILKRTTDFTKQFSIYHVTSQTFVPYDNKGKINYGTKVTRTPSTLKNAFLRRYKNN